MEMVAEGGFDFFAFVFAEQAVIDEDTDELFAYGLVEQGGCYGGIDAARKAAYHSMVADLFVYFFDCIGDEIAHLPVAGTAADIVEEIFEDNLTFWRVRDLGVELDAEEFLFFVFYSGEGTGFCGGELDEVMVCVLDLVAVAFPNGC